MSYLSKCAGVEVFAMITERVSEILRKEREEAKKREEDGEREHEREVSLMERESWSLLRLLCLLLITIKKKYKDLVKDVSSCFRLKESLEEILEGIEKERDRQC